MAIVYKSILGESLLVISVDFCIVNMPVVAGFKPPRI